MNELSLETSPYLLQHAGNPIHWKAWSPKILEHAKNADKLIIVSIGYSACHWCHVMEHESFEDNDVAEIMNRYYISIKVDREERPDVDATYMKAVQLMSGQGGWPMNAILLPDGRPVWGGTYFRKGDWIKAITQLQHIFETDRSKMEEYASQLMEGVSNIGLVSPNSQNSIPDPAAIADIVSKWAGSFDMEYGGMARVPKFMMPVNLQFLQRFGYQFKNQNTLNYVDATLTRMAWGGLFDTVGGGFSRYSVDREWHIPHFEKMLYDNGQLMSLYASAYRRTKNQLYKTVIEKIDFFITDQLSNNDGGFYSALDADSINAVGELEEGAFYSWEKHELKDLLGNDFDLFSTVFNINDFGFWENGRFVLIQNLPLTDIAQKEGLPVEELEKKKLIWEKLLYQNRQNRQPPRLDDKILTSWNALMLKGYADAYKALGEDEYLEKALANVQFIEKNLQNNDGSLWRTYKNGNVKIKGFLDDYALLADGYFTLYEATLSEQWLIKTKRLADYCLDHFYDEQKHFFTYTDKDGEKLVAQHYEIEDNVIPASNSVMGNILYKLSILFDNAYYEKVALQMLHDILPGLDYPSAFSNWMNLWLELSPANRELAICGTTAPEAVKEINSHYLPHVIIAGSDKDSDIPFLKERFVKHSLMFYVCHNKACNLPAQNTKDTLKDLIL
ncbi:thioredoxin domain-containing protein [Flavobacterium rhizosphaerae]|uniref:Thioredoxin domain-containing protein n=1 Tax=Flavobacterium rhizosphaerae TaxID=3163298 RepID=A0ABW8YU50_9FLAO